MFCDEETAVGESEHAFSINAAGRTTTDHRARLARIDIAFLFRFWRPTSVQFGGGPVHLLRSDLFPTRISCIRTAMCCRSRWYSCESGNRRTSGDVRIFWKPVFRANLTGISRLP